MVSKALFSKATDEWSTPKFMYDSYMSDGFFDPCPLNYKVDGLLLTRRVKCYVNPPYSNIRVWLEKAIDEVESGRCPLVVFLVPSRTDVKWFHELIYKKYRVEFIKGRLKFGGATNTAPFPNMLIYIKKRTIMESIARWLSEEQ